MNETVCPKNQREVHRVNREYLRAMAVIGCAGFEQAQGFFELNPSLRMVQRTQLNKLPAGDLKLN
jgi:hypothetical protein